MKFVLDNGVGNYAKDASRIADVITELLADREALAQMSRRAKDLGRPGASYDIARSIGEVRPFLPFLNRKIGEKHPALPGFSDAEVRNYPLNRQHACMFPLIENSCFLVLRNSDASSRASKQENS